MGVDKDEVYVGEDIDLTVTFKRKIDARVDKLEVGEPKVEDFWVKKVDMIERTSEEVTILLRKFHYKLFPQKGGLSTYQANGLVGQL